MGSARIHAITLTGVTAICLLAAGCTSSTPVNFVGPQGTVLFVDGTPHHLPTRIDLSRPNGVGESKRHEVSLVSNVQSQELRASGYVDAFGYTESDVDKLAVPTCNLDEENLSRLLSGTTVVFRGQSASRQKIYDLTLVKK